MTPSEHDPVRTLSLAMEQTADMLARVTPELLDRETPCADWTVQRLVDHLVADPITFAAMLRGEEPDWTAHAETVTDDWEAHFRRGAADLLALWRQQDEAARGGADWQAAEFAVHTWDLARAIGASTDGLDPVVAEVGLAFMEANLTDDNRGGAFGKARPAPEGASAYDRIAAFAGRPV
ncbi:MAG: TIGR03086 family metal-binding protein [Nocardioides sp.]